MEEGFEYPDEEKEGCLKSFIKKVNLVRLLTSLLVGVGLSILIIAIGGAVIFKLVFLLLSFIILGIHLSENVMSSEYSKETRNGIIFIVLTFLFLELGLCFNANYKEIIPIKCVITDEVKLVKNISGKIVPGMTVPYKKVTYINLYTNEELEDTYIEDGDEVKLEYSSSVNAIETYIEYVPFLIYKEKKRFFRKSDNKIKG